MKKVLNIAFILLTINLSIMAQQGFTMEKEISINVPAAELWEMIGPGFVEVYKWASNVDHAEGKGRSEFEGAVCDERFCDVNVKGFSKISEKLSYYNEQQMKLSYEVIEGTPGFVDLAKNTWTVVPIDSNSSKLVMNLEFKTSGFMGMMMNGMMKSKMNKTLDIILNDAKVYSETGIVSDAKQKRINKLQKKIAA